MCDPGFTGPDCVPIFEPITRVSGQDGACEGRGISGDGSFVVGFCQDSSDTSVAFSWTNGVTSPLEDGGGGGEAYGVSTNGTIVVGMAGGYPAKWVNGTRQMHLTLAGTDDDDASGYIMDVSADGNRLAGYSTDPYHIYSWAYWGSSASALPTAFWQWAALQTFQSMADDGDLLVGSTYENGLYRAAYFKISLGFTLWFQDVGSDRDNYAYAVSSNGSTVVGERPGALSSPARTSSISEAGLRGSLKDRNPRGVTSESEPEGAPVDGSEACSFGVVSLDLHSLPAIAAAVPAAVPTGIAIQRGEIHQANRSVVGNRRRDTFEVDSAVVTARLHVRYLALAFSALHGAERAVLLYRIAHRGFILGGDRKVEPGLVAATAPEFPADLLAMTIEAIAIALSVETASAIAMRFAVVDGPTAARCGFRYTAATAATAAGCGGDRRDRARPVAAGVRARAAAAPFRVTLRLHSS